MTGDPDDVVRVASADLVTIELYQGALTDAGITSKVVGTSLGAGIGTAFQNTIELWANAADAERAEAVIREYEAEKGRRVAEKEAHARPTDTPAHKNPEGDHFPGGGRHDYGSRGH